MKLVIPKIQVGKSKAEDYVLYLAKELKFPVKKNDLKKKYPYNLNEKPKIIDFPHEIKSVMETGAADTLQFMYDQGDSYLKTPISIGIHCDVPGIKSSASSTLGSHKNAFSHSGFIEAPEVALSSDIVHYRNATVLAINNNEFETVTRAYRSYLHSCISLVDCFLYRYVFHLKEGNFTSEQYSMLASTAPIMKRLEAWVMIYSKDYYEQYLKSNERSKFNELRIERNSIVHPSKPTISYQFNLVVKHLNLAKDGIGGLLALLRAYAKQKDNIGFIRRIHYMKNVTVRKK